MDVLSDVLRVVRLTGAVYFDIDASCPWVGESPGTAEIAAAIMPGAEHVISFHAVMSGSCWAALSDGSAPPQELKAGDVVVFPGGAPNVMSSSPGARGEPNPLAMYYRPIDRHLPFAMIHGGGGDERTRFICGYLGCDARPFNPLLAVLPEMLCVHKPEDGSTWVTDLFRLALAEGGSGRAGGETILAKLSELMFVEIIRRHLETLPEGSIGWLAGLRDPHVGAALRLVHARPAEDWSLERLVREVGQSRTIFADRFSHYVKVSPMQYLTRWRLQLAGRLLEQSGVTLLRSAPRLAMSRRPPSIAPSRNSSAYHRGHGGSGVWRRSRQAISGAKRWQKLP